MGSARAGLDPRRHARDAQNPTATRRANRRRGAPPATCLVAARVARISPSASGEAAGLSGGRCLGGAAGGLRPGSHQGRKRRSGAGIRHELTQVRAPVSIPDRGCNRDDQRRSKEDRGAPHSRRPPRGRRRSRPTRAGPRRRRRRASSRRGGGRGEPSRRPRSSRSRSPWGSAAARGPSRGRPGPSSPNRPHRPVRRRRGRCPWRRRRFPSTPRRAPRGRCGRRSAPGGRPRRGRREQRRSLQAEGRAPEGPRRADGRRARAEGANRGGPRRFARPGSPASDPARAITPAPARTASGRVGMSIGWVVGSAPTSGSGTARSGVQPAAQRHQGFTQIGELRPPPPARPAGRSRRPRRAGSGALAGTRQGSGPARRSRVRWRRAVARRIGLTPAQSS